jgi:hypothetical protein
VVYNTSFTQVRECLVLAALLLLTHTVWCRVRVYVSEGCCAQSRVCCLLHIVGHHHVCVRGGGGALLCTSIASKVFYNKRMACLL